MCACPRIDNLRYTEIIRCAVIVMCSFIPDITYRWVSTMLVSLGLSIIKLIDEQNRATMMIIAIVARAIESVMLYYERETLQRDRFAR